MINLSTNPQSPLNGRSQAVVGAVAKVPSKLYKLGSVQLWLEMLKRFRSMPPRFRWMAIGRVASHEHAVRKGPKKEEPPIVAEKALLQQDIPGKTCLLPASQRNSLWAADLWRSKQSRDRFNLPARWALRSSLVPQCCRDAQHNVIYVSKTLYVSNRFREVCGN